MPPRTQIIDYGDHGDKFYIILDGVVDIVVPVPKEDINLDEQNQDEDISIKPRETTVTKE